VSAGPLLFRDDLKLVFEAAKKLRDGEAEIASQTAPADELRRRRDALRAEAAQTMIGALDSLTDEASSVANFLAGQKPEHELHEEKEWADAYLGSRVEWKTGDQERLAGLEGEIQKVRSEKSSFLREHGAGADTSSF